MSLAVMYRSEARLDNALKQIRSSSFGMPSSSCRNGRGSWFATCSISSTGESARKGFRPASSS